MPKQTFLNLPKNKQKIILKAAISEFANYGFEAGSINRIVEKSGISKGSFYQYFNDKLDVFKYLIEVLALEKQTFFENKHPPQGNLDTFEYFRWVIKNGMEFNSAYPHLVQAITRVLFGEGFYYGKLFEEYHARTVAGLEIMIKQAMKNGEIDPSIDVDLAVTIMEIWSNAITTIFVGEGMKQKDIMMWVRSPTTQEKIDKMLYVMEYGLRKTESVFENNFNRKVSQ